MATNRNDDTTVTPAPAAKKAKPVQNKYYEVLVDAILGSTINDGESQPNNWRNLKGVVSSADLIAAGADIAWLLKTDQIQETRYVPIGTETND